MSMTTTRGASWPIQLCTLVGGMREGEGYVHSHYYKK